MEEKAKPILPWNNDELKELLRKLVDHGIEATKVDYKAELELSKIDQKAELLKDITSIANSYDDCHNDYGFIVYGVKAGKINGISVTETDTDKLQNTIDQLLKENISPMPVVYVSSFEESSGEKWGVLVVAPRNNKPYMFFKEISCQNPAKSRKKGEWFVRKNSSTVPGLPEDLARITQKQTDALLNPLQEGINGLRNRLEKIEEQYNNALFNVVTKAVSLMGEGKGIVVEKELKIDLENTRAEDSVRLKFPLASAKDGPARFRSLGEALGFEDDLFGENKKEVFLSSGPAMWLRVMPSINPQREWPTRELKRIALEKSYLLPLIHPAGGYSYLRASDGEGMYRAADSISDEKKEEIKSVAFAFKTGEIWSIEIALLSWNTDWFYSQEIEKAFIEGIKKYSLFLKELSISFPFHWKAGLIGIKGRKLGYPAPPGHQWIRDSGGPICASDVIESGGQFEEGQDVKTVLLPFFNKIFEECGKERPDYL